MSRNILNNHFREFIELLEKRGVRYLLVGGYAVGYHGFPRYTGDLDVFIALDAANARETLKVFAEFGFPDLGLAEEDFLEPDTVVEIGREPLKIQILTGIDGVSFEECYQNRIYIEERDLKIPLIGFEELLKNKEASGRGRDRIDLEELRRIRER